MVRTWRTIVRTLTVPLLLLGSAGVASAQGLEPLQRVDLSDKGVRESSRLTTAAIRALIKADYANAIKLADRALSSDRNNPWASYVKGEALLGAGKTKQGIAALDEAIGKFERGDLWGRSVALYGRARALEMNGQCDQARRAYLDYAKLVQRRNPRSADQAKQVASHCMVPSG